MVSPIFSPVHVRIHALTKFSPTLLLHRAVLHDPVTYPDPETFNPDRFVKDKSLPDPMDIAAFGYGRR